MEIARKRKSLRKRKKSKREQKRILEENADISEINLTSYNEPAQKLFEDTFSPVCACN